MLHLLALFCSEVNCIGRGWRPFIQTSTVISIKLVHLYQFTLTQTTTTRALSPVKVTRHFYKNDTEDFSTHLPTEPPSDRQTSSLDWRRFSTNFVPSQGEDASIRLADHGIEKTANGGTNPEAQHADGK